MRIPRRGDSRISQLEPSDIVLRSWRNGLVSCRLSINDRVTRIRSGRTDAKRWLPRGGHFGWGTGLLLLFQTFLPNRAAKDGNWSSRGFLAFGRVVAAAAAVAMVWNYLAVMAASIGFVGLAPNVLLAGNAEPADLWTHNDYATAFRQARDEKRLLLIFFDDDSISCRQFQARASDPAVAGRLKEIVRVRVPLDASVSARGERVMLLDQKGFLALEHGPGLAIVDLKHREAACYGWVVSVWKFSGEESISTADLTALLDLPPGNRQEREAAWAARTSRPVEGRETKAADAGDPTASSQSAGVTARRDKPEQPTASDGQSAETAPSSADASQPAAEADPSTSSPDSSVRPGRPRQSDPKPSPLPTIEGIEAKPQKAVADAPPSDAPVWHADYSQAVAQAKRDGKMLLIHFVDENNPRSRNLESIALQDADVGRLLRRYELLRVPHDATVAIDEQEVVLLKHEAFSEMLGQPGLAIVDYANRNTAHYETVVSQFPLTETLSYSARQLAVMLDLPPGTLTQRTLIYAVRTHPEQPASADGELLPELQREAERHSAYQARILRQGHHQWETRFHRLNALLPRGLMAREVCAESWPGQNLVEAAIECVRCWRLSSGHWSAVRARQAAFGYDMKRGRNGVWYATGVFGGR